MTVFYVSCEPHRIAIRLTLISSLPGMSKKRIVQDEGKPFDRRLSATFVSVRSASSQPMYIYHTVKV